ncbi:hypothetical protein, partial [Vibrio sagamiensis]|uniref:hypothetical protein n=1 Tax=Vibrio sagamiensis TaxID=512650 RepID=UPI0005871365
QYRVESVSDNCQVTVEFVEKNNHPLTPFYDIHFNVVGDVSINPLITSALGGTSLDFSVTPIGQSRIVKVTDDGCAVSTTDTDPYSENHYTSGPVQSECTITVEAEKYYPVSMTVTPAVGGTIKLEDGTPVTSTNFNLAP